MCFKVSPAHLARELELAEKTVLKWRHRGQARAEAIQPDSRLICEARRRTCSTFAIPQRLECQRACPTTTAALAIGNIRSLAPPIRLHRLRAEVEVALHPDLFCNIPNPNRARLHDLRIDAAQMQLFAHRGVNELHSIQAEPGNKLLAPVVRLISHFNHR